MIKRLRSLQKFVESKKVVICFILLFYSACGAALMIQKDSAKTIITSFGAYSSLFRETAYCHLNKNTFIEEVTDQDDVTSETKVLNLDDAN